VQLRVKGKVEAFFCPADGKGTKAATLLSLTGLFKELEDSKAGVQLLLVDACRNDPREGRSLDVDTVPRPPRGIGALFSCSSEQRAFETAKLGGGHGVFFHYVIEGLKGQAKNARGVVTWGGLVEYVTEQVSDEVPKVIGGGARQTPQLVANLKGKSPVLLALDNELAKALTNSLGMKLALIPAGKFLMGSPPGEALKPKKLDEEQHPVELTKAFYLGVHEVTQGQFKRVMGYNPSFFSTDGTGKDGLSYLAVSKPSGGKEKVKELDSTDNLAVENVSWHEAVEFCKKLSARPEEKKEGRNYRLPTEAEWEYSCRAAAPAKQPFHFGPSLSSTQANFDGNFPYGGAAKGPFLGRTCAVGSYRANKFGLFDMHGNVWEWCADWFDKDYYKRTPRIDPKGPATGTHRVLRGGSWISSSRICRAAYRLWGGPGFRFHDRGFRVACSLPPAIP
jgi:formylglycine-generating enzyme required for sulfatase activity